MIEARAIVVGVEDGQARIRVLDRQDGCGRCDEPGGCRSVKLAYALKPPVEVFSVSDPIGVRVGEEVLVRMHDRAPMRGALLSYGLAAVLLLCGAAIGHFAAAPGGEDMLALGGALGGLLLAVAVNRMLYRSRRWRDGLRMELARAGHPDGGFRCGGSS